VAIIEGLVGSWSLRRTVHDRRTQQTGQVRGELTVTEAGGRLRLHETGVLVWAGRERHVQRTTYLELRDAEVWVTFEGGLPFHPWRPGEDVVHPCAEDTYVGRDLDGDTMRTSWRVTGPAKDQMLTTELHRR
jgi:hypothetical protein